LTVPEFIKNQPVIIGGKVQEETYEDFQSEMDMFNKAFAETMDEGDASGRPFTFPIPTYNITENFSWENPLYEPIWEMTAKYGIPYFSNFINSDLNPDDVRSMCCRLRLDKRDLKKRGGGLFGSNPLTGSIGVVTINLPRLGYESDSEAEFFERLSARMDTARESLIIKRQVLERFTERGLYPYSKMYLRNIKQSYGQYWKNHFSTIGIIGMNEALLNLSDTDITMSEGIDFAMKVLDFMREQLADYQEEAGDIFNLEATPAEGASYRLARIDKSLFPDMKFYNHIHGNNENVPYYTNSTQLPVGFTDDVFTALKRQDPLQTKYTGGTVLHCFLGERMPSNRATWTLIKTIAENFRLPYFTLTPTFSICEGHGYISGEHTECPKCGGACEVWSRSVGYLRPVDQWNAGKQIEYADRKTYDKQLQKQKLDTTPVPVGEVVVEDLEEDTTNQHRANQQQVAI
jgi:ribonucleoside-triphosphate reductase